MWNVPACNTLWYCGSNVHWRWVFPTSAAARARPFKVSMRYVVVLFCLSTPFATFAPPLLLACHLRWHGRARALQAACSFSCILLVCHRAKLASFNPISQIHSDVKENETNKLQFSFHPVCHLPILLEVGEWHQLMTKGQRRHEYWRNNCVSERLVASWAILVSTVNKANETRQRESSSPTAD